MVCPAAQRCRCELDRQTDRHLEAHSLPLKCPHPFWRPALLWLGAEILPALMSGPHINAFSINPVLFEENGENQELRSNHPALLLLGNHQCIDKAKSPPSCECNNTEFVLKGEGIREVVGLCSSLVASTEFKGRDV